MRQVNDNPAEAAFVPMKHAMLPVSDLLVSTRELSHIPAIYRWWFPADGVVAKAVQDNAHKEGGNLMAHFEDRLKECTVDGVRYLALYLGKTTNAASRFRKHTKGNVSVSTLRATIDALCCRHLPPEEREKEVSDILSLCQFEWIEFTSDAELADSLELLLLAVGCYPLNIDSNPSVSKEWVDYLKNLRK